MLMSQGQAMSTHVTIPDLDATLVDPLIVLAYADSNDLEQ
jgi:hypothetical protein